MKGVKGTKASFTPNIPKLVTVPPPKAFLFTAKGLTFNPKLKDNHYTIFKLNFIKKGGKN